MPSEYVSIAGGKPKQVSAPELLAEAKSGKKVFLGESNHRIYLIAPELRTRKQLEWNQGVWYTDASELTLQELRDLRKGYTVLE